VNVDAPASCALVVPVSDPCVVVTPDVAPALVLVPREEEAPVYVLTPVEPVLPRDAAPHSPSRVSVASVPLQLMPPAATEAMQPSNAGDEGPRSWQHASSAAHAAGGGVPFELHAAGVSTAIDATEARSRRRRAFIGAEATASRRAVRGAPRRSSAK